MSDAADSLTEEQRKKALEQCLPSFEGTRKNTIDKTEKAYGRVGFIAGLAVGGFGSKSLIGAALGAFGGDLVGGLIGTFDGKREGEKLVAAGVKQSDQSCVAKAEEVFRDLNRAKQDLKQKQDAANKIGVAASAASR